MAVQPEVCPPPKIYTSKWPYTFFFWLLATPLCEATLPEGDFDDLKTAFFVRGALFLLCSDVLSLYIHTYTQMHTHTHVYYCKLLL